MKFWRWLFGGCDHKWAQVSNGTITNGKTVTGHYYYLQCEKCGNMKQRNFR